jgi:AcrR family transcriptional regulator
MTDGFKRRPQSRWGEGSVLREEIISAAARLLAGSGREGDLSLRAVAREAGIAAPSIYLHFKDRADLVATVTEQAYRELVSELLTARSANAEEGPRKALNAMARRYCEFALDNPGQYRVMFGVERVMGTREEASGHPLSLLFEVWNEAVFACVGDRPAAVGADRLARLLWSSLHGIVAMAMTMPYQASRQALEETAEDLLDLVMA